VTKKQYKRYSPEFKADTIDLLTGEFDAASKKERIEIASGILGEVNKLSSYVTTPKPSEIDWVRAERVAQYGDKK